MPRTPTGLDPIRMGLAVGTSQPIEPQVPGEPHPYEKGFGFCRRQSSAWARRSQGFREGWCGTGVEHSWIQPG
jgi:hypothetical protein